MTCDCPEREKTISSEADPCPFCGLPQAGRRSRQVADIRMHNLAGASEKPACKNCFNSWDLTGGWKELDERAKSVQITLTVCEVRKEPAGPGYYVYVRGQCKKCGQETEVVSSGY